jgi:hypothetical protein
VPDPAKTEDVHDIITYFGAIVRQVDSSLLDEWDRMREGGAAPGEPRAPRREPDTWDVTQDRRQFTVLVRNEMYQLLRALAAKNWEAAAQITAASAEPWTPSQFEQSLAGYWPEHAAIRLDPAARSPKNTLVSEREGFWDIKQIIVDPEEDNDWVIECSIDLDRSRQAAAPVVMITRIGT